MAVQRIKRLFGRKRSVQVSEYRGVRTLHLGGDAIQSAMRLSAPERLELAYTQAMMACLLFAPAPRDWLMIGLGGGSIARFVHERMPEAHVTAVEIDPQVLAAARTFFGLPANDERLRVMLADGAKYVPARRAACDVLLLDAFEDGKSVRALATQPFYDACRAALRPHGVLAANFMSDEPRLGTYLARIERAFEGRVLCLPSADRENTIVIALRRPVSRLALAPLLRTARELKRRYALPFDRFLRDLVERNPATRDYLLLDKREAG